MFESKHVQVTPEYSAYVSSKINNTANKDINNLILENKEVVRVLNEVGFETDELKTINFDDVKDISYLVKYCRAYISDLQKELGESVSILVESPQYNAVITHALSDNLSNIQKIDDGKKLIFLIEDSYLTATKVHEVNFLKNKLKELNNDFSFDPKATNIDRRPLPELLAELKQFKIQDRSESNLLKISPIVDITKSTIKDLNKVIDNFITDTFSEDLVYKNEQYNSMFKPELNQILEAYYNNIKQNFPNDKDFNSQIIPKVKPLVDDYADFIENKAKTITLNNLPESNINVMSNIIDKKATNILTEINNSAIYYGTIDLLSVKDLILNVQRAAKLQVISTSEQYKECYQHIKNDDYNKALSKLNLNKNESNAFPDRQINIEEERAILDKLLVDLLFKKTQIEHNNNRPFRGMKQDILNLENAIVQCFSKIEISLQHDQQAFTRSDVEAVLNNKNESIDQANETIIEIQTTPELQVDKPIIQEVKNNNVEIGQLLSKNSSLMLDTIKEAEILYQQEFDLKY